MGGLMRPRKTLIPVRVPRTAMKSQVVSPTATQATQPHVVATM